MFSHADIWNALDQLAKAQSTSPSGLARQAGLDPTTFNKSKRKTSKGKDRWPSTESLSKVLTVIGMSFEEFASFATYPHQRGPAIPIITTGQAKREGFFDDVGTPIRNTAWNETRIQDINPDTVYALEIEDEALAPALHRGNQVLVAPSHAIQKGDKIVIKTQDSKILIKEFRHMTAEHIDVLALDAEVKEETFSRADIKWMGRIIWISQ